MRKTVFQIKYIAAFLIFWLAGSTCMAQPTPDAFTAWTFDDAYTPIYWYGTSYIAEYSDFTNTRLYADGTYGSSQFATVTTSNYAQMLKIEELMDIIGVDIQLQFNIQQNFFIIYLKTLN